MSLWSLLAGCLFIDDAAYEARRAELDVPSGPCPEGGEPLDYFVDSDRDGYGGHATQRLCEAQEGWVDLPGDCDDDDPAVNPDGLEICDGRDNDCDDAVDDDVELLTWYYDDDRDGYGSDVKTTESCVKPAGPWLEVGGDCDDAVWATNPEGTERCDGVDNDCDELIDGDDPDSTGTATWYRDADDDGDGAVGGPTVEDCSQPEGYSASDDDCDDSDAGINRDAQEVCDGIDNDCDDRIDDADGDVKEKPTWYYDGDLDGFGVSTNTKVKCAQPTGYVAVGTDCDDRDESVNPGEAEVCWDGVDNNCNLSADSCALVGEDDVEDLARGRLIGGAEGDQSGSDVAMAGDVNGDGRPDLLVGAWKADDGGLDEGKAYMVRGPVTGDLGLGHVGNSSMVGTSDDDRFGEVVAGPGDLDVDGYDDVVVGAPDSSRSGSMSGGVYIFAGPLGGSFDAEDADVILAGASSARAGSDLDRMGDFDDDDVADLLVGARGVDSPSTNAGAVYVVLGPVTVDASLASRAALTIGGVEASAGLGAAVSGDGDVNGDGYDDVLVGSNLYGTSDQGGAALFHGPDSGSMDFDEGAALFVGRNASANTGASLDIAPDLDGDGYDDVVIAAELDSAGGATTPGAVYVVSGPASGSYSLATDADAVLAGEVGYDYFGRDVSGVGDLDLDGAGDLAIGVSSADPMGRSGAGLVAVFNGPVTGSMTTSDATARIHGPTASDVLGYALSAGADLDGDGYIEFLATAYRGEDDRGVTYILDSGF